MLEHEAKPIADLKEQFKTVFDKTFDPESPTDPPPGLVRSQVFDFVSGLRLIISRDLLDGKPVNHVSGSIQPQSQLHKALMYNKEPALKDAILSAVVTGFWQIADKHGDLVFLQWAEGHKHIPHLIFEEKKDEQPKDNTHSVDE